MIMLQTDRTISLPCGVNDIKDFTINHCDFYFLDRSGCKLIRWSPNMQTIETIALERKYLCICYDHSEDCYWAVPECEPCLIYRLDVCFCEVGHITIKGPCGQRAISLYCDCCKHGLWICYSCQIAFVDKCSGETTWDKHEGSQKGFLGMIAHCECQIYCYYEGRRQILEVISACDGACVELCIPKEYRFSGIASCFCNHCCKDCRFCMLLSKVCSQEFVLMEYSIDFSEGILEPCCPRPCPPKPCLPPCSPEAYCGGIYEIMHSIALEEAGISHILNAEGEKIQKAVAISDDIEQLLCVNESVKHTLTQVTLLEGVLYSKLETLVAGDCGCGRNDCDCDDCRCN